MSDRETWAAILPIVQAFVEGKAIQVKDYDSRWKDTNSMTSLLHNKYRIRPTNTIEGTWSVEFTARVTGSVSGPKAKGTWTWEGTDMDRPPWPNNHDITILPSTERFTPKEKK